MPERVNFFSGRLLTAADLAGEQEYHLEKSRRHNRLLHGWGVVQGLAVQIERDPAGDRVRVEPGYALDCMGNEVILAEPIHLALPTGDPGGVIWLGIGWAEEPVDPVPAPGEVKAETQPSRVREICKAEFFSSEPGHPGGPACGQLHALAIARLRFARIRWREDPGFQPKKIAGAS